MRTYLLAFVIAPAAILSFLPFQAYAAPIPCEDLQVQLESALKTKQPAAADKATFDELKTKGDERCKSEDDRRADDFYTKALAILGM